MKRRQPITDRSCLNNDCYLHGQFRRGNIIRHSFNTTKQGRRRRYRCKECGKTFSSTFGTPYYRLHNRRSVFDDVVRMSVNGVDKSAIARIKHMAWNTAARWLELAAVYARRFNDRMLRDFVIHELQADEIRTFVNSKNKVMWIFTALEVWSRLWICFVVGRRNYGNVKRVIFSVIQRSRIKQRFLMTTDGFEMYEWAVKRLLAGVCLYGQVIKKRRENRVVRVEPKLVVGTALDLEKALLNSEDSSTLNTSFIERHNLTIRQGSAYLSRRSPCHARCTKYLEGHMELLRCYYNFVRPHMALKFGKAIKTPAMQAGLVKKKLSFRDVFTSRAAVFLFVLLMVTAKRRRLD